MSTPNRIEQTTAAVNTTPTQKWTPAAGTPLWASILVGILATSSPVALAIGTVVIGTVSLPLGLILAGVLGGVAVGLGTHFGIKSSGVQLPSLPPIPTQQSGEHNDAQAK